MISTKVSMKESNHKYNRTQLRTAAMIASAITPPRRLPKNPRLPRINALAEFTPAMSMSISHSHCMREIDRPASPRLSSSSPFRLSVDRLVLLAVAIAFQPENATNDSDLCVISCIPHPMTPGYFHIDVRSSSFLFSVIKSPIPTSFKDKFTTNLPHIPTSKSVSFTESLDALHDALEHPCK